MKKEIQSKITLVGAGPGDPELVTLAGKKAIENADVILYDALVNTELLAWNKTAIKIFVGKRKGYKRFSQEKINSLLVNYALTMGHVVRLKGGDPFVFGRGSEEMEYANNFGIETTVVPGISSAISVPASIGIPLTKRGIARSFWVVTGTDLNDELPPDLILAARSSATVVVLMGMGKLGKIVANYKLIGKRTEPIAIVQNGFWPNQKSIIGSIDTIEYLVAKNNLSNPAVIVIGDVANCNEVLQNEAVLESLYQ